MEAGDVPRSDAERLRSWSAARLEVQTSTGRCIGTSAGGFLPVVSPLRRSRNEACAQWAGRCAPACSWCWLAGFPFVPS